MNLKILAGLLTTSIFIVSCGTTINPVQNTAKKQAITDMATASDINGSSTVKFKIKYPSFKIKSSADGYTIDDIDYFLVNLSKSSTDPLAPNQLLSNTWQTVDVNNPVITALGPEPISYDIVIKNVTGGSVNPGATWYGVLRAYASDGHELGIINTNLVGNSAGSRIAVSENSVNVKKSNNKFYTDNTFTTEVTETPVLDINLAVQTGATVGADLNVNPGFSPPDITVIENVPIVCFSCQ